MPYGPVHTVIVCRVGMAGGPGRAGQAGRYKIFLMWGEGGGGSVLSACSGSDTLDSVQHH
jgi:hypothetical protein